MFEAAIIVYYVRILINMEQKGTDDAISFGEFKLVDEDLVKKMIAESMKAWELMYQEKLNALKLELIEVKLAKSLSAPNTKTSKQTPKTCKKSTKNKWNKSKTFKLNQQIWKFEEQMSKENLMTLNSTGGDKT